MFVSLPKIAQPGYNELQSQITTIIDCERSAFAYASRYELNCNGATAGSIEKVALA